MCPALYWSVAESRSQLKPAFLGTNEQSFQRRRITGGADSDFTTGKFHLPGNRLVDLCEFLRIGFILLCSYINRFRADTVTCPLYRINTYVHHGPATCKCLLEPPLIRIPDTKSHFTMNDLYLDRKSVV